MAEASRRAARSVAKGGLPNTLFALASAEQIPDELRGVADSMTLAFPWGSLLRGALALDEAAAQGIRALLAPAATTVATFSIEDRDRLDLPPLHDAAEQRALADRWSRLGLDMCVLRLATQEELAALPSTWARRLAAGGDRAAWRLELQARPTGAATIASRDVNRRPR